MNVGVVSKQPEIIEILQRKDYKKACCAIINIPGQYLKKDDTSVLKYYVDMMDNLPIHFYKQKCMCHEVFLKVFPEHADLINSIDLEKGFKKTVDRDY